jgi:glycosyltransferase involved in cell wall biosynthesis
MNKDVRISIIVPCYNQAQYLDDCLESVLSQIYSNWECIVVNDGSPDNVEAAVEFWKYKDHRFKYIKKENGGLSSARNEGIKNATGTYILPLDADDKISENYLSEFIKMLIKNPSVTLVYCNASFFGDRDDMWNLDEYDYGKMLFSNLIFCSAIFKKEDWTKVGGYDENLKMGHEDWDFWLRILSKDSVVVKLPIIGFFYRKKSGSMIEQFMMNKKELKRTDDYIFKKHIDIYAEHFDYSFIYLLNNYLKIEKNLYDMKNDYRFLVRQVRSFHLLKAIFLKLLFILKLKT